MKTLREAAKRFVFRHTAIGAPRFPYLIEPIQLATLVTELERLKDVRGNVIEIGVARGMTSKFLCEHIRRQGLADSLTYYAVDTFTSFTEADLDFEVNTRGKKRADLAGFAYNDFETWKRNFAGYPFVEAVQGDCAAIDYAAMGPIKMAFLDVDLYQPTAKVLPRLFDVLVPGGVILVDDVLDDATYDGAYQAYTEFCESRSIATKVIGNKCGVIHKA